MAQRVCIYCQAAPATTLDHVPPQCLFPSPRPSSLRTVPACGVCNQGESKDDEYFRATLLASANLARDPAAGRVREVVVRSLQRPQARGLANRIRGSFVDVDFVSPGGIWLGDGVALRVDLPRVHRVLRRTIRGLFFYETGWPLPREFEVDVTLDQFGDHVRSAMKQTFGGRVKAPIHRIGDVFEYAVIPGGDDPTSLWVGCFYRRVFFIAHVRRAAVA